MKIAIYRYIAMVLLSGVIAGTSILHAQDREDLKIFRAAMEELDGIEDASMPELVAAAGRFFLGSPYVAHTLELPDEQGREQLVVNLRAFDCTTLAENCLALARTFMSGETSPESYCRELELIRYREGELYGYTSRLHYFCEWIMDNAAKALVSYPGLDGGMPLNKEINFMSAHPDSYAALKREPELVEQIKEQEEMLSAFSFTCYPLETAEFWMPGLREGDIVGITTSVMGLYISHVGLIVIQEGRPHLLHASSRSGRVVISDGSLVDYLSGSKGSTGIMLARPL